MKFKVSKYYRHTSGREIRIAGKVDTWTYGRCLMAEERDGTLSPVGDSDDSYAANWERLPKSYAWVESP